MFDEIAYGIGLFFCGGVAAAAALALVGAALLASATLIDHQARRNYWLVKNLADMRKWRQNGCPKFTRGADNVWRQTPTVE